MAVPSEGHAAAVPSRFAPEGEATRLLYERHQRKIFSFCKHQLGSREEAEDATQITFMNAFRGLKRGSSPEFESAWLFKIAHNVCLTKQRNSYRRRLVEAPSDFELLSERVPAYEGDTDELFGLQTALRVVPEQQRRALLLREWQGLSYKEIAEEMLLSQAAVETLLFRARRSLADALTSDPAEKRKRGRPRATSNLGSGLAALKSLLIGGSVKIAATVATVAATSVVSVTPAVRHDVMAVVSDSHASRPVAVSAPVSSPHLVSTVISPVHRAATPALAARQVAPQASHQTRAATPSTFVPAVAAETQAAAPVEHPVTVPSTGAAPQSGTQLPSVPTPVPASAPAPVARDVPPAEPDAAPAATPAPSPTPAPAPAASGSTPSAPVVQSTPSSAPAPTPAPAATTTTTTAVTNRMQPAPVGVMQPTYTPLAMTPVATSTTTTQAGNAPATTTPTVTTTPASTQPPPVTTTTTTVQTTTTAAPITPTPVVVTPGRGVTGASVG